ncbi:acyl-CoA dehydrogenase domain-containing protein, partial [Acinetobacter baumannii]
STEPNDVTGRLEHTFQMLRTIEPLWDKFKKAESKGKFTGLTFEENIAQAIKEGFISESEAQQLLQYNAIRFDSMLTDVFDEKLNKVLPLSNPHQIV